MMNIQNFMPTQQKSSLPVSIQAEQSVLGGLMLDASKFEAVSKIITEDDFSHELHTLIFKVISNLARKKQPFDVVTMGNELDKIQKNSAGVGSNLAYVGMLARDTPSAANITSYAQIVKEKSVHRNFLITLQHIESQATREKVDVSLLLSQAKTLISNLAETQPVSVLNESQTKDEIDLLKYLPDGHILKRMAIEVGREAWIPPSTCLLIGLGVFSGMSCRRYVVNHQDIGEQPLGLYTLSEHPSATGKTRCMNRFLKPFFKYHKEAVEIRKEKIKQLQEKQVFEGVNFSQDNMEELTYLLKNPLPSLYLTNSTTSALEKFIIQTKGCFSVCSTEKGAINVMLGISYNTGSENDNDTLLYGFNGEFVSIARKQSESFVGHAVGAISVFAQDGTIDSVIKQSNTSGLCERFLMIIEQHMLGKRDHTKRYFVNPDIADEYAEYCGELADIFTEPKEMGDMTHLWISPESWHKIALYRNQLEPLLADGQRLSHSVMRGAVGKMDIQIMKISANLHLLHSGFFIPQIADEYVDAAINIVNALLKNLEKILISKGIIGQRADWEKVEEYLRLRNLEKSERDIYMGLKNSKPFKDYTGNIKQYIEETLKEMVAGNILGSKLDGNKLIYYLKQ